MDSGSIPAGEHACKCYRPHDCDPSTAAKVDIIVVGAGAAALGVARSIEIYNKNHGPITYKILEANSVDANLDPPLSGSRFGGRAIAAHVLAGAEKNPIYEMKWEQEQRRGWPQLREWQIKWDDVQYFQCPAYDDTNGESCSEVWRNTVNSARNEFDDVDMCVREDEFDSAYSLDNWDKSIGDALDFCYGPGFDWTNNGDLDRIWYDYTFEFAEYPESTSLVAAYEPFGEDPTYSCFQDKDIYTSIHTIIKREYEDYCIDEYVCTGKTVTKIDYMYSGTSSPAKVYVNYDDTEYFEAHHVIVTTSAGVLAKNVIEFDPPAFLPHTLTKYQAMKNVFFSSQTNSRGTNHLPLYYTIVYQFELGEDFWDNNIAL